MRWNAYTFGRLSLNGSNETDYMGDEFPRRTVGTRDKHFITTLNPERIQGNYKNNDLVIKFYDPCIQTTDQIDKNSEIVQYTHGLENIIKKYMETLTEELSYWQSWQRPFSRIITL
ncbi:hypothetical protein MNBD_GAMMA07-2443 [hydrothermal vent metagenome]|uniref:Uncharacterized protein n=1 Tax=hydrothermal vent metagenome TaxID=652676 RepID=A0A3B0WUY3_9ZZZZ